MSDDTVLTLAGVAVEYGRRGQRVRAVDGVDLTVGRGEIVGLVGESGCGKSSLARAAVGLEPLAAGAVTFEDSCRELDQKLALVAGREIACQVRATVKASS